MIPKDLSGDLSFKVHVLKCFLKHGLIIVKIFSPLSVCHLSFYHSLLTELYIDAHYKHVSLELEPFLGPHTAHIDDYTLTYTSLEV